MLESIQLVVGLGNPGPKYAATRHNAGFWCVDRLAKRQDLSFHSENRFFGEVARFLADGIDCWLLKPTTFMNESGRSVSALLSFYRIDIARMLVIHDDIDLPPGVSRLKVGGGHGGHNGLRDVTEKVGSSAFSRVRVGVGHPGSKEKVISSVLSRPGIDERTLIDKSIDGVLELMPGIIHGNLDKAMTVLHAKD